MNQLNPNAPQAFTVGDWEVYPDRNRLYRNGHTTTVENKSMDVLVLLASRAGEVLSNDDLIDAVWNGRPMGENPVYKCIANLRSALGDDSKAPKYIETIPRKGYRLVASVSATDNSTTTSTPSGTRVLRKSGYVAAAIAIAAAAIFFLQRPDTPEQIDTVPKVSENSIAVLPFENLSGDPEKDFFCDGIADELLNRLAKMPGLRVVARHSSFSLGDQVDDLAKFASRLGVHYVLSGSVRQGSNAIRVNARLLDSSGAMIWSDSFDRSPDDIIGLQDDVANAVAKGLALDVGDSFLSSPGRTKNFDAYAAYLHGSELQKRRSMGWGPAAVKAFQDAIRIDPEYAAAYAGLATSKLLSNRTSTVAMREADLAIKKALQLNPNLAEAHAAAGLAAMWKGSNSDYREAEASLRRAFKLNPTLVDAQMWLSTVLTVMGQHAEAMQVLESALSIDPLNPILNMNLAMRYQADGRLDAAREQMVSSLSYPDTPAYILTGVADIEIEAGHLDDALDWVKQGVRDGKFDNEPNAWHTGVISGYYAQLGMFEQADRWMAANSQPSGSHWRLARMYDLAVAKQDIELFAEEMAAYEANLTADQQLTLMSRSLIGRHTVRSGDFERGIRYLEPIFEEGWVLRNEPYGSHQMISTLHFYAVALQRTGQQEKARAMLENVLQKQLQFREGRTRILAQVLFREVVTYLLLGEQELALQRFEEAVDSGWRRYYLVPGNPCLDGLRGSERFESSLASVKREVDLQRERVLAEERLEPFDPPGS